MVQYSAVRQAPHLRSFTPGAGCRLHLEHSAIGASRYSCPLGIFQARLFCFPETLRKLGIIYSDLVSDLLVYHDSEL